MSGGKAGVNMELLPFLSSSARHDLKFLAIKYFVGLSGTVDGRLFINSKPVYVDRIIELASDNVTDVVCEAVSCLVNLAGDPNGVNSIMNSQLAGQLLDSVLSNVVMKGCALADALAMLLSNLSREASAAERIVDKLIGADPPTTLDQLVQVMCLVGFNQMAELHFLAPFLANLSQVTSARKYFMDKQRCVIQRLLPFMKHKSDVRRQGVSMILKNCCFDYEYHDWLLGPEVDILPCLLLPLAGPEEFDEDDMEKLPADLQYLEPDKRREPLAIVRANLVEALIQLCATANGRNFLRQSNTYIIIREYHKSEDKVMNHPMINNLVDILIGDEPSPTLSSNLKELEVPQDLQEQFSNYSKEELKALSTGTIAE